MGYSRRFDEERGQLAWFRDRRIASCLNANESLGHSRVEMRQGFAKASWKRGGGQLFGRNAEHRFSVAINTLRRFFEAGGFGIEGRASHDHLHRMTCVKQGREAVGRGEESVLRDQSYEGFQSFLSPFAVEALSRKPVEPVEHNCGDGIRAGRGGILQRLPADV